VNPNWPLIDVAVSFTAGPADPPSTQWCSLVDRTLGSIGTSRGRQYELDQVQTGTETLSLQNTDGALDPSNTSSPFTGFVLPYRAFRHRAQWPPTVNVLTADQATAFYSSQGAAGAGTVLPWAVTGALVTVTNSGTVNRYTAALPSSTPAGVQLSVAGWSVKPGVSFAAQCQASGSNVSARVGLEWHSTTGLISTTLGTAVAMTGTPATLSVAGTAPVNAAWARLVVNSTTVPGSAATINAWNLQVEQNTAPSSYVQPSTWYPLFTGFVERWPQSWTRSGMFGTSDLTVVDAFGYLSQRKLLSPAYMEILALNPNFLYPLDETTGATLFHDLAGLNAAMGLAGTGGPSLVTSGTQLAGTKLTGYIDPAGISGPVVQMSNNPSTTAPLTVLDLGTARGKIGPPSNTGWTRIIAFSPTPALPPTGSQSYLWFCCSNDFNNAVLVMLQPNGWPFIEIKQNGTIVASGAVAATGVLPLPTPGAWSIMVITMSADGKTLNAYLDGFGGLTVTTTTDMRPTFTTAGVDHLGGDIINGAAFQGYGGQLALIAEIPKELTQMQAVNIVTTFHSNPLLGVTTSGARYQQILRWAAWSGLQSADVYATGTTANYGPPSEMLAAAYGTGTDTVSALQTVVDTDNGSHFVAADGTVTFKARRARYNQNTPVVTFGENAAGGEVPYTDARTGFDPTRIANDIALTQTQTSAPVRATSTSSAAQFGDIQLQRTVNTLTPLEMVDGAQFLLNHYQQPLQRLDGLHVDVGANPTAWGQLLGLELGSRVRVMRRPPGVTPIQVDGFVEQINWSMDDAGNASVDLQVSSNNTLQAWEVSSTRTTLKTAVVVGATSCVVNPLPDSATNPIQANLPAVDLSYNAVIDLGTASAEFITIRPVATSVGYTSATLTVGACMQLVAGGTSGTGFQYAHAVGAPVAYIGDMYGEVAVTSMGQYLSPANVLDPLSTVGTSTILAY
jgi:hypothetical protein